MDKSTHIIILYDYYKKLLNEREQQYFEDYYFNNLTLAEISENISVSRNNVHKTLKQIEEKLETYENALELYGKSTKLEKVLDGVTDTSLKEKIAKIYL